MGIDLIIFDFDGTLIKSEDLEEFRGARNLGRRDASYISSLRAKARANKDRLIYTDSCFDKLSKLYPNIRFAILTHAPESYVKVLLYEYYERVRFDLVLTYEDLRGRTKPRPDGILDIMRSYGVSNPKNVVMIGDSSADILAAYRAGCWAVLEISSRPKEACDERVGIQGARQYLPDGIVKGHAQLLKFLSCPEAYLPLVERFSSGCGKALNEIGPRWEDLNVVAPELNANASITVMGKFFTSNPGLKRRFDWHAATKELLQSKNDVIIPIGWSLALHAYLSAVSELNLDRTVIVTVVPAKPGRPKRMESLLWNTRRIGKLPNVEFREDLLKFSRGVISNARFHLSRRERYQNISAHLTANSDSLTGDEVIIVVDDVLTSGATLISACAALARNGVTDIFPVAMLKTIRNE